MTVVFDKTYLKELYSTGKTSDKKRRYQPDIVKRYIRRIDTLIAAPSKEALFLVPSLHFEALRGDKAGLYSIRVNNQYRVEFLIEDNEENPILSICNIVELSNHYA